jgi:hypothetical protein
MTREIDEQRLIDKNTRYDIFLDTKNNIIDNFKY